MIWSIKPRAIRCYIEYLTRMEKLTIRETEQKLLESGGMDKLAQGVKYDNNKPRFDLLPPKSLEAIAKVFSFGAKKYEPRNWEKGMEWGRIYAAVQRHLNAYWGGEYLDPETKLPHLAHAGFGVLVLMDYHENHKDLDDRKIKKEG